MRAQINIESTSTHIHTFTHAYLDKKRIILTSAKSASEDLPRIQNYEPIIYSKFSFTIHIVTAYDERICTNTAAHIETQLYKQIYTDKFENI